MTEHQDGITCEQRVHPVYEEWKKYGQGRPSILGEFQYIYSSPKGKISLVSLPDYFHDGKTLWEIYSLEGDLFEDVERFNSFREADAKAKELLS